MLAKEGGLEGCLWVGSERQHVCVLWECSRREGATGTADRVGGESRVCEGTQNGRWGRELQATDPQKTSPLGPSPGIPRPLPATQPCTPCPSAPTPILFLRQAGVAACKRIGGQRFPGPQYPKNYGKYTLTSKKTHRFQSFYFHFSDTLKDHGSNLHLRDKLPWRF